ncbi:MAG: DUF1559 domain-containing protein [Verrucomicrobiae bacterium]|nr:DUF1559 domain-containing protein [Verrucomicrobiae bacterium]
MTPNRNQGFSLVEILVAIAILSLVSAMLFPAYSTAKRRARGLSCMNNQKNIGTAILLYAADTGHYPYSSHFDYQADWGDALIPYVRSSVDYKPGEPWSKGMWQLADGSFVHVDRAYSQARFAYFTCPEAPVCTMPGAPKYAHNYSCNELMMPNNSHDCTFDTDGNGLIQYGPDKPLPAIMPQNVERPGSVILVCDAGIFDQNLSYARGDAPDTLYGPNSIIAGDFAASGDAASDRGNLTIVTPNDNDLGPGAGWPVYSRHGGTCYAVMADGHVQGFRNGEMKRSNFASRAKTIRWGIGGTPIGVIDIYYP